jgi:membrane-associated phospholipid phosphatase
MKVSPLAAMAVRVLGWSVVLVFGATLTIVGPRRLRTSYGRLYDRLVEVAPYLGLLAVVLLVNKVARDVGPELSWAIGWNITGTIYAVEGDLVVLVQSVATPTLTAGFAAVYLVGYVFLLVFPIVAYFLLPEGRLLKMTAVSYAVNYGVGVVCYLLFVAYGPRNLLPGQVESLLYVAYPKTQILTGAVNVNTNVFPSLHTSLSVAVATLAVRSRDVYPVWSVVAPCLAAAVALSTMYLGIHWALDVAAGLLLGWGSTVVARRIVDHRGAAGEP